jgi:DNA-binding PadR family transcriptional regulator
MSRRSQTEIAVLGALSVEPMTGYAVRAAITETLGHFWRESFGQIYPTLARLESEGFVRRTAPGQTSGSLFELTPAGLTRLQELLREPYESTPPRNGLLLRLFFGRMLGPVVCRELVEDVLRRALAAQEEYAALREVVAADSDANSPYWLITVAAGEHTAIAQANWAREALAILDGSAN